MCEPSLSPLAGSRITKIIKRTEINERIGVTLSPQFQEPVSAATPLPVMKPRPLKLNESMNYINQSTDSCVIALTFQPT